MNQWPIHPGVQCQSKMDQTHVRRHAEAHWTASLNLRGDHHCLSQIRRMDSHGSHGGSS